MPDNLFSQNSLLCLVMGMELHSSVWQAISVSCFTSAPLFHPLAVQQCYCFYSCSPMASARYKLAFLREHLCENHSCWLVEIVSIEVVVFWDVMLYCLVDNVPLLWRNVLLPSAGQIVDRKEFLFPCSMNPCECVLMTRSSTSNRSYFSLFLDTVLLVWVALSAFFFFLLG